VGVQIRISVNRKGGIVRDRTSLQLEIEVTENGIACHERIRGAVGEFDDIAVDGRTV